MNKNFAKDSHIGEFRSKLALNVINDAVISTDRFGNVDYMNSAAEKITGWSTEESYGKPLQTIMKTINSNDELGRTSVIQDFTMASTSLKSSSQASGFSNGSKLISRDGKEAIIEHLISPIHHVDGSFSGAVTVFRPASEPNDRIKRLEHLALHDYLTGLPNRVLLGDRISHAIDICRRTGGGLSVLFLDLDHFKEINDTLGHDVGDRLLCSVAKRLSVCVRNSDTVSRLGGDEFILLITGEQNTESFAYIAKKIIKFISRSYSIGEHKLLISASIGISRYPEDGEEPDALIKKADMAMFQAKKSGRNRYFVFNNSALIQSSNREYLIKA